MASASWRRRLGRERDAGEAGQRVVVHRRQRVLDLRQRLAFTLVPLDRDQLRQVAMEACLIRMTVAVAGEIQAQVKR